MTFTFVTILITSYELLVTTLETDPNVQRNVCKLSHSIDKHYVVVNFHYQN